MRSIAQTCVDGCVVVVVHGRTAPGPGEWADHLVWLRRTVADGKRPSFLVVTDGGTPDFSQRADIAELLAPVDPFELPMAVVTASRLQRSLITLSWIVARRLRAFAPPRLEAALDHVKVPAGSRRAVLDAVIRLRAELQLDPWPSGSGSPV